MRLNGRLAGTLVTLALMSVVASACSSSPASSPDSSTTSTAAPRPAGSAPALTALTSAVQAQITGNGPNDFDVGGVTKLVCDPPADWKAGAAFTCSAFDFAGDDIGEYEATVESEAGGHPQWTGTWSPK
jgi:hypothetical protein